jgi:hypothetical protein
MNQQNSSALLERSIARYVRALDAGNLDEIAAVLEIAERNAELDRIIGEINWAYAEELGFSDTTLESDKVRDLLQEHFPSAFGETDEIPPLTVGEVAAHLVANRQVSPADQDNIFILLRVHMPLPTWLSLPEIRKLSQQLSVSLSERLLKAFREAAIQMSMGRGQAQMAATRRKTYHRYSRRDTHSNEGENDTK